jgi:hypothetical protein
MDTILISCTLLLFCLLLARAAKAMALKPASEDEIAGIQPDRFRILERLLSDAGPEYLRGVGASDQLLTRYRKSRRQLTLRFLRNAQRDFDRLAFAAWQQIRTAPASETHLLRELTMLRVGFAWRIASLRMRVWLGVRTLDPLESRALSGALLQLKSLPAAARAAA